MLALPVRGSSEVPEVPREPGLSLLRAVPGVTAAAPICLAVAVVAVPQEHRAQAALDRPQAGGLAVLVVLLARGVVPPVVPVGFSAVLMLPMVRRREQVEGELKQVVAPTTGPEQQDKSSLPGLQRMGFWSYCETLR
jgi:hypothetical protein